MEAVLAGLTPALGPRCLVTGGAGYLGRHLGDALAALGCRVVLFDLREPEKAPAGAEVVIGDIRDGDALRVACQGVDVAFHTAAAMCFVGMAPRSTRERVFGVNVEGTRNVIAACRAAGVGRLVHTSTANVACDGEILEADETAPYARRFVDLYGPSKVEAERMVREADTSGGLRTLSLRPGGIWGPGDGGYMVGAFLAQLARGRFVASIGDGRAVVDNTHVYNLVRAELLAADRLRDDPDGIGGRAYFVTDDERINGIEWFRPLVEGLGHRFPSRRLPGGLVYALAWLGEFAHRFGAPEPELTRVGILKLIHGSSFRIDGARRDLGYEPLLKRDAGIALHLDEYRALFDRMKEA